ncbi:zinc carboxypeptidase [Deinococcus sp.]|uniref:zinc carboxypeptidase n=1 Tax=Deinococcus sp. TaxID=47478 RepID=UPI003B5B13EB
MEPHADWPAPIADTTRPGLPRLIWEAQFDWEGQRLLDRIQSLPDTDGPLSVQAYVSESPEMRAMLTGLVAQHLRGRGQVGSVQIRSAYKTGYFYFTEEVQPLWRRLGAETLHVSYPVLPGESPGRFLQELYPLAAVLEREGVRVNFQPGGHQPEYRASLLRGGTEVWQGHCPVPLHPRLSPDGREVRTPTGWLSVTSAKGKLLSERLLTDAERVWDWYCGAVLPYLLTLADERPGLPIFKHLSLTARLSEPDLALGVLDERVSMTEALEEEFYFGTLDALKRRTHTPEAARSLMPGQIAASVISQPGQGGWARAVLTPWAGETFPPEFTAATAPTMGESQDGSEPPLNRPWTPERVWASARQEAEQNDLEWHIPAYSVQGRPLPAVVRSGQVPGGGLLVTGGQHANEATGAVAAVQLIGTLAVSPLPFAVLPLENPDGAHLHRSLRHSNPDHMHHAARYTALGDDLESRQRTGAPRWETRGRIWAAEQVGATLHLNLHGYPAHEWVRPFSGYAPFGFESWALPAGFLTIVWFHPGQAGRARQLAERIAERLIQLGDVAQHAACACRASAAHGETPHYELIRGLPFLLSEQPAALCPLTVITEAPDETIYGERFESFVRAHLAVCEAALAFQMDGES